MIRKFTRTKTELFLSIIHKTYTMDYKRPKKSDKAKRNFELNGKTSAKHVRITEARTVAQSAKQNKTVLFMKNLFSINK